MKTLSRITSSLTLVVLFSGITAPASAQLISDFSSSDLSDWTDTRILKATGSGDNVYSWEVDSGGLRINTTDYDGIEQFAFTRTDFSLDVGFELQADFTWGYSGSGDKDIGLYVGAGDPTKDVREDFVNIYRRSSGGQLNSRGFNGTSELSLVNLRDITPDTLFIARTAADTFELGYYIGGNRNIVTTRIMDNTDIGTAIGFYADVRGTGVAGRADNLSIIPEPSTLLLPLLSVGAMLFLRRRRG